jgi:hypothetical protein
MICLANSIREGDRCVAGIDVESGQWIRPVPPGGGGIPNRRVLFGQHLLELLDIVHLNVHPPLFKTKYQRENRVMSAWDWEVVGKATPKQLLSYCDPATPVLHTNNDLLCLDPSRVRRMFGSAGWIVLVEDAGC